MARNFTFQEAASTHHLYHSYAKTTFQGIFPFSKLFLIASFRNPRCSMTFENKARWMAVHLSSSARRRVRL